jgi:gamma-glutamyltranspeptidase / glutathione hydrolase
MRRFVPFAVGWLVAATAAVHATTVGVVSADARATAAGLAAMAAGGNAVDAAVTAALVLAVVYPEAGNLGGGGFALLRVDGELAALDFREVAPAAATPAMFLDSDGVPRERASLDGPLAAAIPGSPAGYHELHRRHGRLPWPQLVAPAQRLAAEGFEISPRTAQTLAESRDRLAQFPESAAVWLPGGVPLGAGTRLALPDLAATLAEYAARGPQALASGRVAAAIEAASRRHGGVLTGADLAAFRALWRPPLRFERFGWQFAAMPLPSSGGVLLAESLALLEGSGWRDTPRGSADRAHLMIEALRRSFADRFLLGDPASTLSTPEQLLAPRWLAARLAGIDRRRATPSSEIAPGPPPIEGHETTNLVAIDAAGNVVVLTTTLNETYGCALWVPGAGYFLNDEMDDFAVAPGRANIFGLVQGEASAIAAGRRPLSSMAPTLLWRDGDVVGVGGRGGPRIPTAVLQVLANLWDGDAPAAAVARPRIHHQWLPDRVEVEDGALSAAVREELRVRGHELVAATRTPKVNLARRRAHGTIELGADPRAAESAATLDLQPVSSEEQR